ILHSLVVGTADPDGIDIGVGHHLRDGAVGLRISDVDVTRELGGRFRILAVGAPDARDVRFADADERLDVELGDESAADESNLQTTIAHGSRPPWFMDEEGRRHARPLIERMLRNGGQLGAGGVRRYRGTGRATSTASAMSASRECTANAIPCGAGEAGAADGESSARSSE